MKHRSDCSHRGNPVRVGDFTVFAGGLQYFTLWDLLGYDMLVALTEISEASRERFSPGAFRYYPLNDFGGVSDGWVEFVQEIAAELKKGKRIMVFCIGSHGRTGTLLASLIAMLEPETEDPITAVRERHCSRAVETKAQAKAIFALRGEVPPAEYFDRIHFLC